MSFARFAATRNIISGFRRLQNCLYHTHPGSDIPIPPRIPALVSPEDSNEARSWIARFQPRTIPRGLVELSFARSSGPGGQNVNKVNTKATVRCPVDAQWIPLWARQGLEKSPFYVSSTCSILITSTVHRSQHQNVEDCLSKLHGLILAAASAPIKTEPSESQKKRVRDLERAAKANRRREKSKRSEIKRGRKSGGMYD